MTLLTLSPFSLSSRPALRTPGHSAEVAGAGPAGAVRRRGHRGRGQAASRGARGQHLHPAGGPALARLQDRHVPGRREDVRPDAQGEGEGKRGEGGGVGGGEGEGGVRYGYVLSVDIDKTDDQDKEGGDG